MPFALNIPNHELISVYMDWDSKPANAASFWVAYVLNAFQKEEEQDGDPDRQGTLVLARCDRSEGGSLIYVEHLDEYVGRDEQARLAEERCAVVHEIGHLVANSGDEPVTRVSDEPYRCTEIYLKLICSNAKPAGSHCLSPALEGRPCGGNGTQESKGAFAVCRVIIAFALGLHANHALAMQSKPTWSPPIEVKLRASKPWYLLGEPIRLHIAVTNLGESPLTFLEPEVRHTEPEIRVLISRDRKEFRQYCLGICGDAIVVHRVRTLQPGEVCQYEMRVLYDAHQPGNLAFPEAGEYWVKVVYPLDVGSNRLWSGAVFPQESAVVRLHLREPEGEDVAVWKIVRSPPVLAFLQTGHGKRNPEIPAKMVEVLARARRGAYEVPIRWALREYLAHEARRIESWWNDPVQRHTLEQMRVALGVPKLALYSIPEEKYYEIPAGDKAADGAKDLFPEDRRLDRPASSMPQSHVEPALVYDFRSLDVGISVVSKSRGVPLRLATELAGKYETVGNVRGAESVRAVMRNVTPPGAKWVKDGDGYMLVPAPKEPKKP